MYCKFCGNRITSGTKKCPSCGADIDMYDGGQSFYDDNELFAWQTGSADMGGIRTSMPKTQLGGNDDTEKAGAKSRAAQRGMAKGTSPQSRNIPSENKGGKREPAMPMAASYNAPKKPSAKADDMSYPFPSAMQPNAPSAPRRRRQGSGFGNLKLSTSNKIIIFCIASALAIVLLIVAIINVFQPKESSTSEGGENTVEEVSQEAAPETGEAAPQETAEDGAANEKPSEEAPKEESAKDAGQSKKKNNDEAIYTTIDQVESSGKHKVIHIPTVSVMHDDKDIGYDSASAYMIDDILYISADKVLKNDLGYKPEGRGSEDLNVVYKNGDGGTVTLKRGYNEITISAKDSKNSKNTSPMNMAGNTYNDGDDTFVPAESFLKAMGYNTVEIKESRDDYISIVYK